VPSSKRRRSCHNGVSLGNLSVSRERSPDASPDVGSCRATLMTVGDREDWTRLSLAPFRRPERRIVRERSIGLSLCLEVVLSNVVYNRMSRQSEPTSAHTDLSRLQILHKLLVGYH